MWPWLEDGWATLLLFELFPNIKLYETEVTMPGFDNGDMIPQENMRSDEWTEAAFQKLKTLTEGSGVFAFHTDAITNIRDMIGKNQLCTVILPNNFKGKWWGGIRTAVFAPFVKGTRPTVTLSLAVTNRDRNGNRVKPAFGMNI